LRALSRTTLEENSLEIAAKLVGRKVHSFLAAKCGAHRVGPPNDFSPIPVTAYGNLAASSFDFKQICGVPLDQLATDLFDATALESNGLSGIVLPLNIAHYNKR
jgi:hypothetical protein